MKRFGRLMLLAALAGPGCLTLPPMWKDAKPEQPAAPEVDVAPPPPVLPEQVNESNAKEMLNALREELDYAANERPAAPKAAETNKPKP
jgi:hypothetical protein